jgi:RND family efflux transporter MFP subunit
MKGILKAVIVLLVVAGLIVVAVYGGAWTMAVVKLFSKPSQAVSEEQAVGVIVASAQRGEMSEVRSFGGNVEPLMDVELMPQIQGKLVSLMLKRQKPGGATEDIEVTENLEVKEGEVIATLDYEGLKADWDKAEADYQKALRDEEHMQKELVRVDGLLKQGFATDQEFEEADWKHKQSVEDSKSRKAVVDQAKWRYDQAFLKAPFDGVVSKVYVDVGATVGPNVPVVRLIRLDELKVITYVPNIYIGGDGVLEGVTDTTVTLQGNAASFDAKVFKIYAETNRPTRDNPVEIRIPNKTVLNEKTGMQDYVVRGNMYATVKFKVRTVPEAIKVSADAVVRIDADDYLFVVEDGVARRRKVTTGIWQGPFVQIVDGLNEGDTVVIVGQTKLADGTKVKIVETSKSGIVAQPTFEQ